MTATAEHKPQRNSPERADMLAKRRAEQLGRRGGITPIASKARLSTRGERGQTWRTKAWTPARVQARDEHFKRAA